MIVRDFKAQIKAVGTDDGLKEGQFLAIVSTFGNVDSYGDRVVKGAFAEDVERWKDGEPLPIVWSHKWDDPFSHIGVHDDVEETDAGLKVLGTNDLDNPTAVQVHRLLKSRRIRQFSFAYDVIDGKMVDETVKAEGSDEEVKRSVYELHKLKTFEVGPCLVGVNQETQLLGAKAANLAAATAQGRRLDGKSLVELGEAVDRLREVITLHRASAGYSEPATSAPSQTSEPHTDDDPQGKSGDAAPEIPRRRAMVETMFL